MNQDRINEVRASLTNPTNDLKLQLAPKVVFYGNIVNDVLQDPLVLKWSDAAFIINRQTQMEELCFSCGGRVGRSRIDLKLDRSKSVSEKETKVMNCSKLRLNNVVFNESQTAIPGRSESVLSFDSLIYDNVKELYLSGYSYFSL